MRGTFTDYLLDGDKLAREDDGTMEVTFFGTRGSSPVAGPEYIGFGGNTTCLQIESGCLPQNCGLVIDAGTGFLPMSSVLLKRGIMALTVLSTHYHHDHTQGALLSALTFSKGVRIAWYGPEEDGIGPAQMLAHVMKPPYFPVDFAEVASHFACKGISHPSCKVIAIHPEGGLKLFSVDELERLEQREAPQVTMGGSRYPIGECLIIRMLKTNHPERTISYRFEERPTSKVFVFLTDHENLDGMPRSLEGHLRGADLLVMDAQYGRAKYDTATAGFGHGTPDYCARVAHQVGVARLGLTHHDPLSSDEEIGNILKEAGQAIAMSGSKLEVFACADYLRVVV